MKISALQENLLSYFPTYIRGGEPNEKNQLFGQPEVNSIVIPIYKNGEKRIFDHWVHLNPPHLR